MCTYCELRHLPLTLNKMDIPKFMNGFEKSITLSLFNIVEFSDAHEKERETKKIQATALKHLKYCVRHEITSHS